MGEITYQGESPFLVPAALGPRARVSGLGVRMTVYASVDGRGPTEFQIEVPLTPEEAQQLAGDLTAAVVEIGQRRRRR
jgi:hypothetical protein